MTHFRHSVTQTVSWQNEHGTFKRNRVERILPIASRGGTLARWRKVGAALKEAVGYAFAQNEPIRIDGSRWSLSNVGLPKKLALSLSAHDVLEEVPSSWISAGYKARLEAEDLTPMIVSGSMKISRINRFLTLRDLALRTSGASNGQTLAGATQTGTHGAAISFGAMHDFVRAVHVMVAPNKTVLVQPSSRPLKVQAQKSLQSWFSIPTELISDDDVFNAVRVGLGAMGVIVNFVIECEPLYFLTEVTTPHRDDASWKGALRTVSPRHIPGHFRDPLNLGVLFSAYKQHPSRAPRAWVTSMKKTRFSGQNDVEMDPTHPSRPSPDVVGLVSDLADFIDTSIGNVAFRKETTAQLVERMGEKKTVRRALPGVLFGPTGLPKGNGHSLELCVDAAHALAAVESVLGALQSELSAGRQFLGAVSARFVGASAATLAPNIKSPSCFIELPGIYTDESTMIYEACGRALAEAGIPFGCHWGQYLTHTRLSLENYWSPEDKRSWKAARRRLLPSAKARRIFASPILRTCGLGD